MFTLLVCLCGGFLVRGVPSPAPTRSNRPALFREWLPALPTLRTLATVFSKVRSRP